MNAGPGEPRVLQALERAAHDTVELAGDFGPPFRYEQAKLDADLLRELREALAEIVATKNEIAPVGESSSMRETLDWKVAIEAHAGRLARLLA